MDDSGIPVGKQIENRMKLAEAYDRFGFHAYHLAEHHGTPLGLAPSPGLFMAALAQRTKRLRFGPLVYLLPLYHPLRRRRSGVCGLIQIGAMSLMNELFSPWPLPPHSGAGLATERKAVRNVAFGLTGALCQRWL